MGFALIIDPALGALHNCTASNGYRLVFASPLKIDRLPYSYTDVRRALQRAADAGGIGKLTTHVFRHSFRTWLNQTGAPVATQQRLMRHSNLAMTMDTYGTTFDAELTAASSNVAESVFVGPSCDRIAVR